MKSKKRALFLASSVPHPTKVPNRFFSSSSFLYNPSHFSTFLFVNSHHHFLSFRVFFHSFRFKMIDFSRVQKELVECRKDAAGSGIQVSPKSDNLVNLIGTIPGPTGTPYEGGVFQIEITIPGTKLFVFGFLLFIPNYCFSFRVS